MNFNKLDNSNKIRYFMRLFGGDTSGSLLMLDVDGAVYRCWKHAGWVTTSWTVYDIEDSYPYIKELSESEVFLELL